MIGVAPYVGAWIETSHLSLYGCDKVSHPTWVRGLKLNAPLLVPLPYLVAPYVGAWIETAPSLHRHVPRIQSHPTWVRGLKLFSLRSKSLSNGRTLRGCVD